LNSVATHIADVDYQTITVYTGGYDDFVEDKYNTRKQAEAQNAAAKKKKAELQSFIDRFGSHASKSKQAQSRVKMIEKLEVKELKRSSLVRPFVRFEFEKPSGRDVLRMERAAKKFAPDPGDEAKGDKIVFTDVSMNVNRGDRIAVTGPNGVGKSTLLKMMVAAYSENDEDTKKYVFAPDAGEARWGHETSVGYFAQDHHEAIGHTAAGTNAFQWLYQFDKLRPQDEVRGILGRLLFAGEAALKPVEALSGGECARLMLAKLLLLKHNVLVLDEPTNHLDIESIEGLLDGIKLFKGTVVFVSHDRHFVSELATRVIEIKPGNNGKGATLNDYGGTYEEFLERKGADYTRRD
jgi:ATPase subunit of ABC transporter with duplicated ATPase domains